MFCGGSPRATLNGRRDSEHLLNVYKNWVGRREGTFRLRFEAGVYGAVLIEGMVRIGDEIEVLD